MSKFSIWMATVLIGTFLFSLSNLAQKRDLKFEHFTTRDGLSQSTVTCILQDSKGFMWFGTRNGLNRFDGYSFTNYLDDADDSTSIAGSLIYCILEDDRGNLWIGTDLGLNRFDQSYNRFIHYRHDENDPSSLDGVGVGAICEDIKGNLWIGNLGGNLDRFDYDRQVFIHYPYDPDLTNSLSTDIRAIHEDTTGRLWIGTLNGDISMFDTENSLFLPLYYRGEKLSNNEIRAISGDKDGHVWISTYGDGLYQVSFSNDKELEITQFKHEDVNPFSLSSDATVSIYEDSEERLWIGTENAGLNLFDRATERFIHYYSDPLYAKSINNNSIWSIYQDNMGNLWIGTYAGGVNMLAKYGGYFDHYVSIPGNEKSLSHSSVTSFLEDSEGSFWVGTDGGGLNLFDREKGTFTCFNTTNSDLSSDAVLSIFEDSKGQLWIGTWAGGLNLFDREHRHFIHYNRENSNLASDNIFSILEDANGVLWLGAHFGGLSYLDPGTNSFVSYVPRDSGLVDDRVGMILEDSYGDIVLGAAAGLFFFDPEAEAFTSYVHDDNNRQSLSNGGVISIAESADSTLWIGTGNGLNKFDRESGGFTSYYEKDGLPSNAIKGILVDKQGNLWLSTNRGISRFDPEKGTCQNYDISDGLQENEFYQYSYYQSPGGTFYFGGVNGFNAFRPEDIQYNPRIPPVVFTDFRIFNKAVSIGKNSPLHSHISETDTVRLSYRQTFFSFEFTALNYISSEKNQYAWKLEGFDKDWIDGGSRHMASYTNIDPGTYTFKVKASNNDGIWNEKGNKLTVIITPPFWQTLGFKIAGILLLLMGIGLIYYLRVRQIIIRNKLLQKLVDQRTNELNEKNEILQDQADELTAQRDQLNASNAVKDKLFSIISHDIRSPFNSLNGFIELINVKYDEYTDEKKKEMLGIISGSAKNVYTLLDNLLSWSRSQRGTIKFNVQATEVVSLISSKIDLLRYLAQEKNIEVESVCSLGEIVVELDPDLIAVVLQNLLTNAIKFTHQDGKVQVDCRLESDDLTISVSDNGVGIPEENLEMLFSPDNHFTTRGTKSEKGTGLGLIVCKDFVDIHHGQIWVESVMGKGSTFFIKLPLKQSGRKDH